MNDKIHGALRDDRIACTRLPGVLEWPFNVFVILFI